MATMKPETGEASPRGLDDVIQMLQGARDARAVLRYEKFGEFAFRPAAGGEKIVTEIDGEVETTNIAKDGDFVLTGARGENWLVSGTKFGQWYQVAATTGDGGVCVPSPGVGEREAFEHRGGPFSFEAPWGEPMICNPGDMIMTTGEERDVYRIKRSVFDLTYRLKLAPTFCTNALGAPWALWAEGVIDPDKFDEAVERASADHPEWKEHLANVRVGHHHLRSIGASVGLQPPTVSAVVYAWCAKDDEGAVPVTAFRW